MSDNRYAWDRRNGRVREPPLRASGVENRVSQLSAGWSVDRQPV
jgi:hypothetical protein